MTTTYIYALKDPRDGAVRYVGKADNPRGRYLAHLRRRTWLTSKKDKWLAALRGEHVKPELIILEEVSTSNWEAREQAWIEQFGSSLFNGTPGGRTTYRDGRFSFSEDEARKLAELARANTSGNEAALVRSLINRAYLMPSEFGLLPPQKIEEG